MRQRRAVSTAMLRDAPMHAHTAVEARYARRST
jgi:hypothetical protein